MGQTLRLQRFGITPLRLGAPLVIALGSVYLLLLLGGYALLSSQYHVLHQFAGHTHQAFMRHLSHLRQTLGQMEWLAAQASPWRPWGPGEGISGKPARSTAAPLLQREMAYFEPALATERAAVMSVRSAQTRLAQHMRWLREQPVSFTPPLASPLWETYDVTQTMTSHLRQEHQAHVHTFRQVLWSFYWQWGGYVVGVTFLCGLCIYGAWRLQCQAALPAAGLVHVPEHVHLAHLEHDLVEMSEREKRRIGQDLHDGIGQLLTGIAFLNHGLANKLAAQGLGEAAEAQRIGQLLQQATMQTRDVAKGLVSAMFLEQGLAQGLQGLAIQTHNVFGIVCHLHNHLAREIYDHRVTTHLYRITQEAIHNAIRHGQAQTISITLGDTDQSLRLEIRDDGCGFSDVVASRTGMGLRTMQYRADLLGGQLIVRGERGLGTQVICVMPQYLANHSAASSREATEVS